MVKKIYENEGKTVGFPFILFFSTLQHLNQHLKRRVLITDENESSYYVKPLGSSEVKEGWVNKNDVSLLRIMVRK